MTEIYTNPVKAIRAKCIDCCGHVKGEVKDCTAKGCPLWPFRMGTNPFRQKREMTMEQKEAAARRLSDYHKNRERQQGF